MLPAVNGPLGGMRKRGKRSLPVFREGRSRANKFAHGTQAAAVRLFRSAVFKVDESDEVS